MQAETTELHSGLIPQLADLARSTVRNLDPQVRVRVCWLYVDQVELA